MGTQVTKLIETLPLGEDGLAWGFCKDLVAIADDYDLENAGLSDEHVFKVEVNGGNVELNTYTTYCTNDSYLYLFIVPKGTALEDLFDWYERLLPTLSEEVSACLSEDSLEEAFPDLVNDYSSMEEFIDTLENSVVGIYDGVGSIYNGVLYGGVLYHGTVSANGKDYWVLTSGAQC